MLVEAKLLKGRTKQIVENAKKPDWKKYPMWVVPETICVTSYIRDDRYWPGNTTLEREKQEKAREDIVEFVDTRSPG